MSVTAADLAMAQVENLESATEAVRRRQVRLAAELLDELEESLKHLEPGSWGEASQRAAMVVTGQAVRTLTDRQTRDLAFSMHEVTKLSTRDAAVWLSTLDNHYLG